MVLGPNPYRTRRVTGRPPEVKETSQKPKITGFFPLDTSVEQSTSSLFGGYKLSNKELYALRQRLRSDEGLPVSEWQALAPAIQQNLLGTGEDIRRLADFFQGEKRAESAVQAYYPTGDLVGGRQPVPEWARPIQRAGETAIAASSYPLFHVGDYGVSAADIAMLGTVLYGGYVGLKPQLRGAMNEVQWRRAPLYKIAKQYGAEKSAFVQELRLQGGRWAAAGEDTAMRADALRQSYAAINKAAGAGTVAEQRVAKPLQRYYAEVIERQQAAQRAGQGGAVRHQPPPVSPVPVPRATQTGAMAKGGTPSEFVPAKGMAESPAMTAPVIPEVAKDVTPIVDKWQKAKTRNSSLVQKDLDNLQSKGYEVEDAQAALDEYKDTVRSDFDSTEEYSEARSDAWDSLVDTLDSIEAIEVIPTAPVTPKITKDTYVSGITHRGKISSGKMMWFSKELQQAEYYAGKKGQVYYGIPKETAKILDLTDEWQRVSFEQRVRELADQDAYGIRQSVENLEEHEGLSEGIVPSDIVEQGGIWDEPSFSNMVWEEFEYDFIKLPDGGIALNTDAMELSKMPPSPVPAPTPTAPVTGMAPSTSVQTGLPGMGKEAAQAKMLEEWGTAPGAAGQRQQLVDVEAIKAAQSARPLEGQEPLVEPSVSRTAPPEELLAEYDEVLAQQISLQDVLAADPVATWRFEIGQVPTGRKPKLGETFQRGTRTMRVGFEWLTKSVRDQAFPTEYVTVKQARIIDPEIHLTQEDIIRNKVRADHAFDKVMKELRIDSIDELAERVDAIKRMRSELYRLNARMATVGEEIDASLVQTPPSAAEVVPVTPAAEPPAPPEGPPEVPELPIIPEGEPVPEVIGNVLPALQDPKTLAEIMFNPDFMRKLVNLPMVRNLMPIFSPAAVASDSWHQFVIIRAGLYEEAAYKSKVVLSKLRSIGEIKDVYGRMDPLGRIRQGPLVGKRPGDVMSQAGRYKDVFTDLQKRYNAQFEHLNEAKLNYLKLNEIDIHELAVEEGGMFVPRKVYARTVAGETVELGYVGAGPGRPGARLGTEKGRVFKTEQAAIEAGFREINPDEALYLNILGAYRRVADKLTADWFFTQVPWRTTGADPELIAAAQKANIMYRKAQTLKTALNRAVRGERVPEVIIRSIGVGFPSQAQELRELVPRIQAGESTADAVKKLDDQAKGLVDVYKMERLQAQNARARSREAAMRTRVGEGRVQAPAFQAKVITGPQAMEAARYLNVQFAPKSIPALVKALGDVNAVARYFVLAQDFSVLFIQGLFMIGYNPRIWAQSFIQGSLQAFADPKFVERHLAVHTELYYRHPTLIVPTGGSIEATEAFGAGGLMGPGPVVRPATEESLKAAIAKTPFRLVRKGARTVLEPFQRGMEGFLLVAGTELAKSLEHVAKTPADIEGIDQFINEMRGLTSTARIGVGPRQRAVETLGLMAPRYFRAVVALMHDAAIGAATAGQGSERSRLAIIGLLRGVAAVSAIMVATAMALGERDPKELRKIVTPGDPDFWTVTIPDPSDPEAGTRVGPGGKFRSIVNTIGNAVEDPGNLLELSMENPVLRFARGNASFVSGSTIDILTGRTYIGDPVTDSWQNFAKEVFLQNMLPIWIESTLFEGGSGRERAVRGFAEFGGWRSYPEPFYAVVKERRAAYAKRDYNKPWDELRDGERDELLRKHPDLADLQKRSDLEAAKYGDEHDAWVTTFTAYARETMHTALDAQATALLEVRITKYEYDKARTYIRAFYSGGKAALWHSRETLDSKGVAAMQKWLKDNQHADDKAMDDYQEYRSNLIERSELPISWDSINAQCDAFLRRYSLETQNYIATHQHDWMKDLPENARKLEMERLAGLEDETWWDNYRGETPKKWWSTPQQETKKATTPQSGGGVLGPNPYRR